VSRTSSRSTSTGFRASPPRSTRSSCTRTLQQTDVRAYHADFGIRTEAWSPLAKGGALLTEPAVEALAKQHDRTPAQVVLRWHLQLGNIVVPKSVTPSRIRENLNVFDFTLTADDMTTLSTLDRGKRTGPDPDSFNVT
jgi:diketogulonate reductase-like aldo/keto reductase